jgi:hypothetical protein
VGRKKVTENNYKLKKVNTMKKVFALVALLAFSFAVMAQTPARADQKTTAKVEKTCADYQAEKTCPKADGKPCGKAEGKCPKTAQAAASKSCAQSCAQSGKPCGKEAQKADVKKDEKKDKKSRKKK